MARGFVPLHVRMPYVESIDPEEVAVDPFDREDQEQRKKLDEEEFFGPHAGPLDQ